MSLGRSPGDERVKFVRMLLLREPDHWVAQCIDFDIVGQGKSLRQAIAAFDRAVLGRFEIAKHLGVDPFANLPPAPESYRRMYDEGISLDRQVGTGKSAQLA